MYLEKELCPLQAQKNGETILIGYLVEMILETIIYIWYLPSNRKKKPKEKHNNDPVQRYND
jgi:hypothetical protein